MDLQTAVAEGPEQWCFTAAKAANRSQLCTFGEACTEVIIHLRTTNFSGASCASINE